MKTLTFDYDNRPGLARMYAIPPESFRRLRYDYILSIQYIEVVGRDNIIEIPIFADNSFTVSEKQSSADGGDLWEVGISGCIPKNENAHIVELLERGDWLVICQDQNGTVKLYGSVDIPLRFLSDKSSGSPSAMNGIRFTFSAKEPEPSVTLANDITTL